MTLHHAPFLLLITDFIEIGGMDHRICSPPIQMRGKRLRRSVTGNRIAMARRLLEVHGHREAASLLPANSSR
jgi:hypothetical protein